MKKRTAIIGLWVLCLCVAAVAATRTSHNFNDRYYHYTTYVENTPELIPAILTDVWTTDVWLEEITLTNSSDGSVTVTVQDKQGTPRAVLSAVSLDARSTYVIRFSARYCPGGVSWSASSGTAVVGYIRGKR